MKGKRSMNSLEKREWLLCSRDSRDIIITYVCNLNNIPVENNYKHITQKKIEKECRHKVFTIKKKPFWDNIVLGKTLKLHPLVKVKTNLEDRMMVPLIASTSRLPLAKAQCLFKPPNWLTKKKESRKNIIMPYKGNTDKDY